MKIELLTKGNISKVFEENSIQFTTTYCGDYNVVEIDKGDLAALDGFILENNNAWWRYSKGARTGSACDFIRVNGSDLIGWFGNAHKESYDTLLDYLKDEIGVTSDEDICDYAVSLSKVNGMTLSKLFSVYGG